MSEIYSRLLNLFTRFHRLNIVMMGDFFIDQYLDLERSYSETSLETGLEAYQVVDIRNSLGAAGTVANNLRAMDVKVKALTLRGYDANGFVMQQLMLRQEIDIHGVVIDYSIHTPTYIKPMMKEKDGCVHELNRMDIKNRHAIYPGIEVELTRKLAEMISETDVILVTDQVQEEDCGVLTAGMRDVLSETAKSLPGIPIWVDSRERGHLFSDVSLKTNLTEARKALLLRQGDPLTAQEAAIKLFRRIQRPVLITDGNNGIAYCNATENGLVPALQMEPPLDIVGAGDSVLAAAGSAIAAGATLREAALIGCLAASVTIKKIGTTGTATIKEMLAHSHLFEKQQPDFCLH
ncbi:MAG: PfkB family carbohydrate kinase [Anaerolineae bacterium]|nr:PfkB family carbohydrate kinase [Anaerolineae bacterium]